MATEATVRSRAYRDAIQGLRPQLEVVHQACPLLVPLVEQGWVDDPMSYHRDPPPLIHVNHNRRRYLFQTFDTISFDSGYEPHWGEPGRERWLSYEENRKARALVLRHDDDRVCKADHKSTRRLRRDPPHDLDLRQVSHMLVELGRWVEHGYLFLLL